MACTVCGAMALQSASTVDAPAVRAASPTAAATPRARAGTRIDRIRSQRSTSVARSGTASSPAASARSCVAGLRPARQVRTERPLALQGAADAGAHFARTQDANGLHGHARLLDLGLRDRRCSAA